MPNADPLVAALAGLALAALAPAAALAEADGPDAWDVTGVPAGDTLNLRAGPGARQPPLAQIPRDATGLRNLGCSGGPSFAEYMAMGKRERARANATRWCKVEYGGRSGWVAARFLRESADPQPARAAPALDKPSPVAAPSTFGAWRTRCDPRCRVEQSGAGGAQPAALSLEPSTGGNARVTLVRAAMPRAGHLELFVDGQQIAAGPVAPLLDTAGGRLVMEPDDITLALVRRMQAGGRLVMRFSGEDREIAFPLDGFADALRHVAPPAP